jgi:phage shock protein PspC (stress-responsive transcriptional regulator)
MCEPAPRSQCRGMNTDTMNPQDTDSQNDTPPAGTPAGTPKASPRYELPFGSSSALRRPFQDRMVAGVAAGIARYFGVDVTIVRIAFAVLTVIGGAGIPLYLAGLLLIPDEGSNQSIASSIIESLQNRNR